MRKCTKINKIENLREPKPDTNCRLVFRFVTRSDSTVLVMRERRAEQGVNQKSSANRKEGSRFTLRRIEARICRIVEIPLPGDETVSSSSCKTEIFQLHPIFHQKLIICAMYREECVFCVGVEVTICLFWVLDSRLQLPPDQDILSIES